MLKTGASLVVTAIDDSADDGQKEYYASNDAQQIAARRSSTVGRKRKRRPQATNGDDADNEQYWRGKVNDDALPSAISAVSSHEETNVNQKLRRRKQPAIREPLAALEKEQKLYELRDKQRQEFGENGASVGVRNRDKSYRRPYGQAKKEIVDNTPITATTVSKMAADLKHILKNSGGLSLSEILQQKNLSLDDLLKGKQNALLALQTTAAAPAASENSDAFKNLKPARRIPPAFLGGSTTAESENNSAERDTNDETQNLRNKLKFPTLQRLKLFGTSSRATAIPLPGSGEASTKKRSSYPSTTATTSTSTTTRLPLYKKRAQQRPTLKPPSLFKTTAATPITLDTSTTKETPTPKEQSTTAKINAEEIEEVNINDEQLPEKTTEEDSPAYDSPTIETTTEHNEAPIMTTLLTESPLSSTTTTTTTTTTTVIPRVDSSSNSRRNKLTLNARQRVKSKFRERFRDDNFKSNSIEITEPLSTQPVQQQSKENDEKEQSSTEQDEELENYPKEMPRHSNRETSAEETTAESITPRIDRTNVYQISSLSPSAPIASTEESLPDFDGIDDRTDLLELIEDHRSGNRLFKVLQQRNMTLDQLIEHRKRGSSQLHLATIVEQNARSQFFPGQKVVLHDNVDIVTAFENFPLFNLLNLKSVKPDDIKTDSQGSSYFTSIIDIEPTDEAYKAAIGGADVDSNIRGPKYTEHNQRTDKSLGFFPSWKTLALASLTSTTKGNPFYLPQPSVLLQDDSSQEFNEDNLVLSNDTSISSEQQVNNAAISVDVDPEATAEAIENEVARAHDLLDLELSGHAFKRSPSAASMMKQQYNGAGNLYANMPAGIRSAIVASAAIVLTSLATFMVIFVVCRLKQRKRSKTNYLRTYNAMKSKMPVAGVITTTKLGKTPSTSNSRRSSLRNSIVEDMIEDTVGGTNNQIATVSNISATQRQNDLLYSKRGGNSSRSSNSKSNLLCGRKSSCISVDMGGRHNSGSDIGNNNGGFSSVTGSTSSLALSLRSAHNISSAKLNTMDPNSPEVREYLFDTLRKSFN